MQKDSPTSAGCGAKTMALELADGPRVVAEVDGEVITSNTGVLRLGAADRAIGLIEWFAECCTDTRGKHRRVDALRTRAGQRVHAIAPGHGDLVDQGRLRHGPTLGAELSDWRHYTVVGRR